MTQTLEEEKRVVAEFYDRLWNRWDASAVPELLSPSIKFRGSLGQSTEGHSGFIEYMNLVRGAFPDFTNTIEDMLSEGNKVFAKLTYRGTHKGEVFGIAPTGRTVRYSGAALFTFQGAKISAVWVLGDLHGLLEQLQA